MGFCIVIGTLSVMSVITAAAIKQRKTRAQGNNTNSTINNELTYIRNNLVTSTGFGAPFSKNTTAAADRLPPCNSEVCYSPLVEQFTADIPPPVYSASGHASV